MSVKSVKFVMKLEEEEQELTFIDYNCPGSENILIVPHVIIYESYISTSTIRIRFQ